MQLGFFLFKLTFLIAFQEAVTFSSPPESNHRSLKTIVVECVNQFPQLIEELNAKRNESSPFVRKILNLGSQIFRESTSFHAINKVDPQLYPMFVDSVLDTLVPINSIVRRNEIRARVFDAVALRNDSQWVFYRILVQEMSEDSFQYYGIMSRNNLGAGYDFVFVAIKIQLSLEPDVIIIAESNGHLCESNGQLKFHLVQKSKFLSYEDIGTLLKKYDLITFHRFAKMFNIPVKSNLPTLSRSKRGLFHFIITLLIELINTLVWLFQTTVTNNVVKSIFCEGYQSFYMEAYVHHIQGLRPAHVNRFINVAVRSYAIPPEYTHIVKANMRIASLLEKNVWMKHDIVYDKGDGTSRWITILSKKDENERLTYITVTVNIKFSLAPNFVVIETSKSNYGLGFTDTSQTLMQMPRSFFERDRQQLFAFFNVIVLQRLAAVEGTNIPPSPSINTEC